MKDAAGFDKRRRPLGGGRSPGEAARRRGVVTVCLALVIVASLAVASEVRHPGGVASAVASETSAFTAMTPQRLVDTRIGLGVPKQIVAAGTALHVQVTGRLGIPASATAIVANVIAVNADRPGFLQLLPTGRASFGSSSTLNTDSAGQTIPNASFAPLGDNGQLSVYVSFTTDVVIDVSGYFTPAVSSKAGRLVPLTPARILDSRIGLGWTPPPPPSTTATTTTTAPTTTTTTTITTTTTTTTTTAPGVPPNPGDSKNCSDFANYQEAKAWFDLYYPRYGDVASLDADGDLLPCESLPGAPEAAAAAARLIEVAPGGTTVRLQVAGRGGVPSSGASAVVMNVAAVNPAGPGFVQVAPTPVVPGASSNLNTSPGQTIANLVVVPLGTGGKVDLLATTDADLIADVVGYFTDATAASSSRGLFVPIAPSRQLDTREPGPRNPLAVATVTGIDVTDVSPTAIAIAGNLTATQPSQPGFLQLAAPPLSSGASSSLNITYAGQTIANAVVSPVASGQLQLFNSHSTHALLDVTGWFTSLPPTPPTTTTSTSTTTMTPAPDLQATPASLHFQFADVHPFEPVQRTVVVRNEGNAPTGPIEVNLDQPGDNTSVENMFPKFKLAADSCSGGLAPGGSCTITVEISIPLGTNGYGKPFTWKLKYGPDLTVPLTSATDGPLLEHNGNEDFRSDAPDFLFDNTTTSHTLLIRNIGGASGGPISVPTPPAPFSVSADTCNGQSLDVGEVCSMTIDWTPPDTADFYGMIVSGAPVSWQYTQAVDLYAN